MSEDTKLIWANNIRVIATLAVIFIHSSSVIVDNFQNTSINNWIVAVCLNSISRWAVPVFVMLTGTFVLDKYNHNLPHFLIKTFRRIVVPFLCWSLIYLFFYNWDELFSDDLQYQQKISLLLNAIINGSSTHLWYIYMILSLYLIIPVISKWTSFNYKKEILFFIGIWFILLFFQDFLKLTNSPFEFNYFTGYIGYLILGSYLSKIATVHYRYLLGGFLIGLATTICLTYFTTTHSKELNVKYLAPLTPNICLMSTCIYLLFKQCTFRLPAFIQKAMDHISTYTYGIFLIHFLLLSLIDDYVIGFAYGNPIITIPLISFICFFSSYFIVFQLKKIPYLMKLIG